MSSLIKLYEAVNKAEPLLRMIENQLASSLSCDSRSHDEDRPLRRQVNDILAALKECQQEQERTKDDFIHEQLGN